MIKKLRCVPLLLLLFTSIYFVNAQHVYQLKIIDCDQTENIFEPRRNIKILTAHEIIESFPDLIVFKTSTDRIKVSYENLYDQKMDTVFIPKERGNDSSFYLCLDNFKDNQKETCIENAIKKKARWKFNIVSTGCSGRFKSKIIIIPKKNKIIAKYVYTEYVSTVKKYKRFVKYRILSKTQLNDVVRFEKKLRLHGDAVKTKYGDQIRGLYLYTYTIRSGNMEKEIKSSLTLSTIDERYLLEKLGFEK